MIGTNSKFDPRFRALAYLVGAALAVAVIVWAESEIWYCVNYLRQRTETVSSDGFHLSDQLEARMRELDANFARFSVVGSSERRNAIEAESEALGRWLAGSRRPPLAPAQQEVLARMESVYARYVAHASQVLRLGSASSSLSPSWRDEQENLLREILALGRQLNLAEKAALSNFMAETRASMSMLYGKLILSSVLLLVMGAVLAYVVYRGVIVPLQLRLRESQRVIERQEKLSSLGVLAAGVAHEIRNPLTSIKARLFTQQSLLDRKSEAFEDNEFITEEISRLEKIVSDFLAFARPSEPKRVRVNLAQLLRDLEGLFKPALTQARIELKKEFLVEPEIQADPNQLRQVLINLVQNAAESIGREGTITLRTRTQKPHRGAVETRAVVEVEDDGKGVSQEVQHRLFDPFYTTKANGTGLGLSIAARLVEKHGGALEYQPGPERGAIFRLVLPMATSEGGVR
ncbi:MAG: hypothetical protein JNN07_20115 [Verrucomicrobiales bacterium]|nr:hypothetical protein [Verrucomicrobiales bacterium]